MNTLPPLFRIERLLPHIHNGDLILTPNNRLRSKILQAWGHHQQTSGETVWYTPRIRVIDQWFDQQWKHLQAQGNSQTAKVILNNDQQRVIWESITAHCGLMQTNAVAKQIASAYNTLQRWELNPRDGHGMHSQALDWIKQFEKTIDLLDSITQEDTYPIIGHAFDQNLLAKEAIICLLGFDDIAPLLHTQLEKSAFSLVQLPSADHTPLSLQRLAFDTSEDEMNAAAQWARSIVEKQPESRIGIIVPNLGQCRQAVEMAFVSEFEAHSMATNTERYTLPFNVSAGTPLGDTPLIASALHCLTLHKHQWDVEAIATLLLSPFWGEYSTELALRCRLVDKLQSLGTFTITGSTLRYWAERLEQPLGQQSEQPQAKGVFHYLHALHTPDGRQLNSQQLPSAWVDTFLQQLDILQWPGERTPDSQEYQQTQLWYQLLETLAGLDAVMGVIDNHTALQQLQVMANSLPFQAKVPDSPIQILGILEGAGLDFTHCWVMGLHQHAWPPAPSPNNMLPISLQREHNMPHASSLRELQYAQSLTENYRYCADHIIVSAPQYEDDSEQALSISQLIADIPLGELSTQAANDSLSQWSQQLQASSHFEAIHCDAITPYTDLTIPGGAGMLKAQAENPFDCVIKHRLKASSPLMPVNGFSSIEKGNILHNALASIWATLNTQAALLALSEAELDTLINERVAQCINDIRKHKLAHLSDTLCQIESERQSQLIRQWLEIEKTRAPFTVVAIEEAYTFTFDEKEINVRIDRVDQLSDGRLLIIDYKTGKTSVNAWKGERPKEPQLPLYALCFEQSVAGISFAEINVETQYFKGVAEAELAKGIASTETEKAYGMTWAEASAQWQKNLSALLSEFVNGDCAIRYRDNATLTSTEKYNTEYLRLNRFYEADAISAWMGDQL